MNWRYLFQDCMFYIRRNDPYGVGALEFIGRKSGEAAGDEVQQP